MKSKSSYIFLVLLFLLFLSSCSFLDSVTEKTTIKVTQPIENYRDTREIGDQPHLEVALSILVTSNKRIGEVVPVSVTWNGSAPVTCFVVVNDQTGNTPTPCGMLPMYKDQTGQQTLTVEMEKLNGKKISDTVVFVWEPLAGFDIAFLKVAQLLGSQNPTMGMVFLIVAVLVIFSGLVAIKTKSIFGVITVFIASTIGVVLVYSYFSPELGLNIFTALLGFLGTSFIFSLVGYAINKNYGASIGGSYESYGYDEFGRPVKTIWKKGIVNVSPHGGPYLPPPDNNSHYKIQPGQYPQQPGYPQIPPQYQQFLPPPTEYEQEQVQQQERPKGLLRILSAFLNMNKRNRSNSR